MGNGNGNKEEQRESLKNLIEVVTYLKGQGWKVSKSAVYRHRDQAKIGPQSDGGFLIKDVDRYARDFLQRTDGSGKRVKVQPAAAREKQSAEARKVAAQAEHWEIKTRILRGEYVERSVHERALAMRAARLKSDGENDFRNNASEGIRVVDGDMTKLPDFIDWLLQLLENWLDRYSEDVEFDLPAAVDMSRFETIRE